MMKSLNDFARIKLGVLPTPFYKLENLSKKLGKNIYIKRDDMTGVSLGGNKVRKLEFLLADAMEKGCDYVLTTGGAQSNHAMLTAACANRLGMKAILVLKQRGVTEKRGNLILDDILGADVRFVDSDSYDDVYAEMHRIEDDLAAGGHKAYHVPVGGSVPLGVLGYVGCAKELFEQADAAGVKIDRIVSCIGSGGTYAGLALGAKLCSPGTPVTG
ncbi:MAG: pyridoxal-phosphate dependent enzyme, partial [Synergistaceae bacterium]